MRDQTVIYKRTDLVCHNPSTCVRAMRSRRINRKTRRKTSSTGSNSWNPGACTIYMYTRVTMYILRRTCFFVLIFLLFFISRCSSHAVVCVHDRPAHRTVHTIHTHVRSSSLRCQSSHIKLPPHCTAPQPQPLNLNRNLNRNRNHNRTAAPRAPCLIISRVLSVSFGKFISASR